VVQEGEHRRIEDIFLGSDRVADVAGFLETETGSGVAVEAFRHLAEIHNGPRDAIGSLPLPLILT
jgi:hypothetical protein